MCLNSSGSAVSLLFSVSLLSAVSGSTLSSLISSWVRSLKPRGQLLPTLGPVICWALLSCLWLPSGRLSGLRFGQTSASLQIIIRLRPAVWHASTGPLLLIELDPMLEVTEKWTVSPQRAMWLADLERRGRLRMACWCVWLMSVTQCLSHIHPDIDVCFRFHFMTCVNGGQVRRTNKKRLLPGFSCERESPKCLFIVPSLYHLLYSFLAS